MPKSDESLVPEFAREIAAMGGPDAMAARIAEGRVHALQNRHAAHDPDAMAARIAEGRGWSDAWSTVIEAVDLIPQDKEHTVHRFAAETVARALYKAMQKRGINAMWPLRFGQP